MTRLVIALLTLTVTVPSVALGEVKKQKDLPQSGTLSATSSAGTSAEVPNPWGGVSLDDGKPNPISGSVSKVSANQWMMKVFNNSQDPYSVSLEVEQLDTSGRRARSDYFSYTLKAGASAQQPISASPQTRDMRLNLRSWKNLAKKKPEATGTPAAAIDESAEQSANAEAETGE